MTVLNGRYFASLITEEIKKRKFEFVVLKNIRDKNRKLFKIIIINHFRRQIRHGRQFWEMC